MKHADLSFREIALIGGTRAALGAGIGLLLAGKLDKCARKNTGLALLGVGALSTIPLVRHILGKSR